MAERPRASRVGAGAALKKQPHPRVGPKDLRRIIRRSVVHEDPLHLTVEIVLGLEAGQAGGQRRRGIEKRYHNRNVHIPQLRLSQPSNASFQK